MRPCLFSLSCAFQLKRTIANVLVQNATVHHAAGRDCSCGNSGGNDVTSHLYLRLLGAASIRAALGAEDDIIHLQQRVFLGDRFLLHSVQAGVQDLTFPNTQTRSF